MIVFPGMWVLLVNLEQGKRRDSLDQSGDQKEVLTPLDWSEASVPKTMSGERIFFKAIPVKPAELLDFSTMPSEPPSTRGP